MFNLLDSTIEAFLLNMGMSARATDFTMLGVGALVLLVTITLILGTISVYAKVLIRAYRQMLYNKSPRLRRNWSIIFLAELLAGVVLAITYFI